MVLLGAYIIVALTERVGFWGIPTLVIWGPAENNTTPIVSTSKVLEAPATDTSDLRS